MGRPPQTALAESSRPTPANATEFGRSPGLASRRTDTQDVRFSPGHVCVAPNGRPWRGAVGTPAVDPRRPLAKPAARCAKITGWAARASDPNSGCVQGIGSWQEAATSCPTGLAVFSAGWASTTTVSSRWSAPLAQVAKCRRWNVAAAEPPPRARDETDLKAAFHKHVRTTSKQTEARARTRARDRAASVPEVPRAVYERLAG